MPEAVGAIILEGLIAPAIAETAVGAGGWVTTTTLASAGFGAVLGVSAATIVGSAALLGGSVALAIATAPSLPKPSDGIQSMKQQIPPRPFGYGRARLAGAYVLYEVDALNHSWDVLALHHGLIQAFVLYYLNEDIVVTDGSSNVVGIVNAPADGRYGAPSTPFVNIQGRLGHTPETYLSNVASSLPTLWTSAHRGDGIASLSLQCNHQTGSSGPQFYTEQFPRGIPKLSAVCDLKPIYDPRDVTQTQGNPATWKGSSNPVWQLVDYLTQGNGPGLNYQTAILPVINAWVTEANICDNPIPQNDTTLNNRYASNGWAYLSSDPAEVISTILSTCDGWLAEKGDGTLALWVGLFRAPTVTFLDQHILGYELHKGVADEEVVNELKFSFTPPANDYREAAGNSWLDNTSISLLGKIRSQSLQLHWVQSHTQARRLAKRAISRHLAPIRGTLVTSLYGLKGLGERWIAVQSSELSDLNNVVIEIMPHPKVDLLAGKVTFQFVTVNPATVDLWNPATEEGRPPFFYPPPTGLTFTDLGGGSHKIQVQINAPNPATNWLSYVIGYRPHGGSQAFTLQILPSGGYTPSGGLITMSSAALTPGTYDVMFGIYPPQSSLASFNALDVDWQGQGSFLTIA